MAYTALIVTHQGAYNAVTNPLSSSHVPAYPETTTQTVFDTAFYQAREDHVDKLNP